MKVGGCRPPLRALNNSLVISGHYSLYFLTYKSVGKCAPGLTQCYTPQNSSLAAPGYETRSLVPSVKPRDVGSEPRGG